MNIEIKNLVKKFNDQSLFDQFNTSLPLNKSIGIVGESGRGKTTLLRMIAGLDSDYQGDIANVPHKLTFLFQENSLLPWKNVRENIIFPVTEMLPKNEIENKVDELLTLTYMDGEDQKFPSELSGGMQRRVALCRALIYPSNLLLLDEPFSGLDDDMKHKIADRVFEKMKDEKTMIIVTHDRSIIEKCQKIIIL